MQIVSDLQQRGRKSRLKIEKLIVPFYDMCTAVQLVTFLIHTVTVCIGARQTFVRSIFVPNDFALTAPLAYKIEGCNYTTVRNIYAFMNVNMTFGPESISDVFVDHAIQMRLAIFVCAVALAFGVANRACVEINFFKVKFRNLILWKDLLSATELILLAYVFQIAAASHPPARLLQDYLIYCRLQSRGYLPFVGVINLWVFAAVGYFAYGVGLVFYLYNSLPKYGVMRMEEIAEYKAWLLARRREVERSQALLEAAKRAHARWQLAHMAPYMHHGPAHKFTEYGLLPAPGAMLGEDGVYYYPAPYAAATVAAPPLPPPGLDPMLAAEYYHRPVGYANNNTSSSFVPPYPTEYYSYNNYTSADGNAMPRTSATMERNNANAATASMSGAAPGRTSQPYNNNNSRSYSAAVPTPYASLLPPRNSPRPTPPTMSPNNRSQASSAMNYYSAEPRGGEGVNMPRRRAGHGQTNASSTQRSLRSSNDVGPQYSPS